MLKVVHVTWEDPCFAGSGWMTQADFETWVNADTARSDSVGILAYECESFIVLIQSVGEKQVADGVKISRAAILQIKELAELPITLEIMKPSSMKGGNIVDAPRITTRHV